MADKRQEWVNQIETLKAEANKSGEIHRRDLWRRIHKMQKELKQYDLFRQASVARKRSATAKG